MPISYHVVIFHCYEDKDEGSMLPMNSWGKAKRAMTSAFMDCRPAFLLKEEDIKDQGKHIGDIKKMVESSERVYEFLEKLEQAGIYYEDNSLDEG